MTSIRRVVLFLVLLSVEGFQAPIRTTSFHRTSLLARRQPSRGQPRGQPRGKPRQTKQRSPSNKNRDADPFGDYEDDERGGGYESSYDFGNDDENDDDDWASGDSAPIPKSHFFSKKALKDPTFHANPKLFDLLCEGVGIDRPSRIQSLAWPVLLQGKHAIVADQTGSGKTLAYLLPLLQRTLSSIARDDSGRRNGAPRLLVLSPTAELADQIRAVCEKLAEKVPFRTMVITATGSYGATSIRDQIRVLQRQPVDVMISTPGRIATILRTKNAGLDLSNLEAIVLDEVDVLLVDDDTFGPQLRTVGAAAPMAQTQFVFCTATLPDHVVETVEREFASAVHIRGPGLHRVAPTVEEHLVDVSVPSQYNRDAKLCFDIKAKQLLKALLQTRCRRTLIFCNTVESCRQVENLLNRKDRRGQVYNVGAYHNAMTPQARNQALRDFTKGTSDNADHVLVCTDRAARGVDFDAAPVDHVVLYDFPKDPAEYVRRVGRTARAGRTGTSTVFGYGWQLPIARSIMGSKLTSFTIAADEEDDENNEFKGGVQGRRKQQRKLKGQRDSMIKGNIEKGKLWKERGQKY